MLGKRGGRVSRELPGSCKGLIRNSQCLWTRSVYSACEGFSTVFERAISSAGSHGWDSSISDSFDSVIVLPAVAEHLRQMASKLPSGFSRIANPGQGGRCHAGTPFLQERVA